ncbi:hypothetical protein OPQ81_008636 [Rhizoctonia solani]|nr:hypothetical protein OPQ81_008636 [Rhizoctonia solani]
MLFAWSPTTTLSAHGRPHKHYLSLLGSPSVLELCIGPLHQSGLKAVKKVKKPKLTRAHIKARLEFAKAHKDWTVEDWKHVLWSDETKINCLWSDGVHWAWARPGEGLSDQLIVPTANFGGGSLMFWGCMGWNGTGHGTKIDSRLNKELYVEILADEFLDSLDYLEDGAGEGDISA